MAAHPDVETQNLLSALADVAAAPPEKARSAPPGIYTSRDILDLELRSIFSADWLCAGLAADIPKAGDYLTYTIGEEPVVCIRQKDGTIRTVSNVCRHRMMLLLDGWGTTRRIVCPYHAWTYDLNGKLIGAGHMANQKGFKKTDHCLPDYRTEIWHGWIYITANADAPAVSDLLADLDPLVSRYQPENYVPVTQADHVWETNWKLLCENFMEGYHLPVAHRATVGTWMPVESTRFPEARNPAYTYQTFTKAEDATFGRAHEDNKTLDGEWRQTTVMPTVFPSHMYILAPDHLWYLTLRPQGVEQVQVRFGVAIAPEVHASLDDPEKWIADTLAFFDQVNAEDRFLVEGIFRGARAPSAVSGPLSWLEREISDFLCYLSARLSASGPAQGEKREAAE